MHALFSRLKSGINIKKHKLPFWVFFALGLGFLIGLYVVWFVLPKNVELSYSESTCVQRITLLPDKQQTVANEYFEVDYRDTSGWGPFNATAGVTCFTPKKAPKNGEYSVKTAPWGNAMTEQTYNISVSDPPKARLASVVSKPIPVSKPMKIPLETADRIFDYTVDVNKQVINCDLESKALECPINQAKLGQGKTYEFALLRKFKGSQVTVAGEGKMTTLKAVTVKKSPLKKNQVVYDKPKSFVFKTDKELVSAKANIVDISSGLKLIKTETSLEGKNYIGYSCKTTCKGENV